MKHFHLFIAALFMVVTSGCSDQRDNRAYEEKEDVKIAVFHHILSTSFVAALIPDENGQTCFDKAGLKPLINKRSRGPEVVDSIISGSVEFGTLAITPQVFQLLQGNNLMAFATYQTSDQDIKFIGRKSAGILSPQHIREKRIGYVGGTYGEIFLERYLEKHSIERESLILTSGAPAYLRDLFLTGELDGAVLWEPVVQDIILDPSASREDLFIDVDRTLYTARVNLLALPEVLAKNESKAGKIIQALICSESYLEDQPQLVRQKLESWLGRQKDSLDGAFYPETFRITFDRKNLLADLRAESLWANEAVFNGKSRIPENFDAYVTDRIMLETAPSRIVE